MKIPQINSESTLNENRASDGEKLKEQIAEQILDARVIDNRIDFFCSIRGQLKPMWIQRSECKAGNLIQQFFDNRLQQFLLEANRCEERCLNEDILNDEPSTSAAISVNKTESSINKPPSIKHGRCSTSVSTKNNQIECLSTETSPNRTQQALSLAMNKIFDAQLEFKNTGIVLRSSNQQNDFSAESIQKFHENGISTIKNEYKHVNGNHTKKDQTDDVELREIDEAKDKLEAIKSECMKDESFRQKHQYIVEALEAELEKRNFSYAAKLKARGLIADPTNPTKLIKLSIVEESTGTLKLSTDYQSSTNPSTPSEPKRRGRKPKTLISAEEIRAKLEVQHANDLLLSTRAGRQKLSVDQVIELKPSTSRRPVENESTTKSSLIEQQNTRDSASSALKLQSNRELIQKLTSQSPRPNASLDVIKRGRIKKKKRGRKPLINGSSNGQKLSNGQASSPMNSDLQLIKRDKTPPKWLSSDSLLENTTSTSNNESSSNASHQDLTYVKRVGCPQREQNLDVIE